MYVSYVCLYTLGWFLESFLRGFSLGSPVFLKIVSVVGVVALARPCGINLKQHMRIHAQR
jgi:hypothetical protein